MAKRRPCNCGMGCSKHLSDTLTGVLNSTRSDMLSEWISGDEMMSTYNNIFKTNKSEIYKIHLFFNVIRNPSGSSVPSDCLYWDAYKRVPAPD